jgi:glycosyltransferase involved in cell wall biosynthesis
MSTKATLTVFTPTYNRAYCLTTAYEALKRQTLKDFKWLIIDDGSTDNSRELIESWINEGNDFIIEYHYKTNGGLHTGYNHAIERLDTELCVCIDSDDFMPDDAVENIVDFWKVNGSDSYAGIIGLDYLLDGTPTGGDLPNVESLYLLELVTKYNYTKDTKVVYRSQLLKEVAPQPTFANEKNFNPIYLMFLVDKKLPLLVLNKNLCFVDYQVDGMTNNIYNQFINSPNSFAALRKVFMTMPKAPLSYVFKQNIHYVSSSIFSKDKQFLKHSPFKLFTLLAIPFGVLLNLYIRKKATKK